MLNDYTAHQDAWQKCGIAHCDISPANIQIRSGRGILADWEFGTPVDQLSTDRAVNSVSLAHYSTALAHIDFQCREHSISCHHG